MRTSRRRWVNIATNGSHRYKHNPDSCADKTLEIMYTSQCTHTKVDPFRVLLCRSATRAHMRPLSRTSTVARVSCLATMVRARSGRARSAWVPTARRSGSTASLCGAATSTELITTAINCDRVVCRFLTTAINSDLRRVSCRSKNPGGSAA